MIIYQTLHDFISKNENKKLLSNDDFLIKYKLEAPCLSDMQRFTNKRLDQNFK